MYSISMKLICKNSRNYQKLVCNSVTIRTGTVLRKCLHSNYDLRVIKETPTSQLCVIFPLRVINNYCTTAVSVKKQPGMNPTLLWCRCLAPPLPPHTCLHR
jgi:hypothetical protein